MRAGVGLALLVASVAALLFVPLLLKASDELRRYRPDGLSSARSSGDLKSNHNGGSASL